jgi:hypothetical protein
VIKPGSAEIGRQKIATKRRGGKSRQNLKVRNRDRMQRRKIAIKYGCGKSPQSTNVRQNAAKYDAKFKSSEPFSL